jgi:predicted nucleic acid-binding protein
MYLAGRAGGCPMQQLLWRYVRDGALVFHDLDQVEIDRMMDLMDRYRATPMDLADASLVVAAEHLGISRIFTLDHHFRVYRLKDSQAFEVVP